MSHFTVLVIGPDVEKQLAPYHEFECTGYDNEYVQTIDVTAKSLADYERHTVRRFRDPEGNLHDPYTPEGDFRSEFWRDLTPEEEAKYGQRIAGGWEDGLHFGHKDWGDGRGYRPRIECLPEGWQEVQVKSGEVETFAEFIEGWNGHKPVVQGTEPDLAHEHKYGYCVVDGEGNVICDFDRTNPRKKWDWYSVGGRWTGFFKLKNGAVGHVGEPGLMTERAEHGTADLVLKGDIDIDGMRDEAGEEAGARWDKFHELTAGCPPIVSFDEIERKYVPEIKHDFDDPAEGKKQGDLIRQARDEYHAQPGVQALRKHKDAAWWNPEDFACTREQYVQIARDAALATFAVVKDGQWYQRGEMGWWGCVSDEKDRGEWLQQFAGLVDGLSDDTPLTLVDCHI